MSNKSPLRYPGGKTRACKVLYDILNNATNLTNYTTLISPFFGGGSFEFYLQNKFNYNVLANDKFKPLIEFWKHCKTNNSVLCTELCKHIGNTDKAAFNEMKSQIMKVSDFISAVYYFIINRCSFSGSTCSGGFSKSAASGRFTNSSIDRISKLKLDKFTFSCHDFVDFINNTTNNNAILFVDPPYYLTDAKSKLYGINGDLHAGFNHIKLRDCLQTKKNWILTYNNCKYIRKLYANYKILNVDWKYGMNKSKESSEIVILNF